MQTGGYSADEMRSWARRLYSEGVDRKDAAAFADAFVSDGWLRFGNNEPLTGRDAIRDAIAGFFTLFASLSHEERGVTWADGALVLEADVTYTLHGGGTVTVPACTIFRMAEQSAGSGPQAARCQIYVDLAPLFGALQNPVS